MFSHNNRLALSAALAMGIANVVCIVFCMLWPQWSLDLMAQLIHLRSLGIDASTFRISMMIATSSVAQSMLYTYLIIYLWAWIYGKMSK